MNLRVCCLLQPAPHSLRTNHDVGDALLCGVDERNQSQLRPTDILGRISGDEFVLVLDPYVERREISMLINRVRDLLKKPFIIEGLTVK